MSELLRSHQHNAGHCQSEFEGSGRKSTAKFKTVKLKSKVSEAQKRGPILKFINGASSNQQNIPPNVQQLTEK